MVLFLLLFLVLKFISPNNSFATSDLIITGFASSGATEWVEIKNTSLSDINLSGLKIIDGNSIESDDISLSGCISAGSRKTFSRNSGWLNDDSDTITLGTISIAYGSSSSIAAPREGYAMYQNSDETWSENINSGGQNTSNCIAPTNTPTLTPTPSTVPSLTPTPSVTNTPSPTPTPTVEASIKIETFPSLAHVYQAFSIRFLLENLSPNTQYTFKGIGGINGLESLETYNAGRWYGYTGAWENHPKFTSDSSGKINQSISMRVKSDQPAGEYKVQIKVKEIDKTSDIKYITIKDRLPTSTPTPNNSPTPTPTPEPEDDTPTNTPTPLESDEDIFSTMEDTEPTPEVLGEATKTNIDSQNSKKSSTPFYFMAAGAVFLLAPIAITQYNRVKKNS